MRLSFSLAFITTLILLHVGIFLGYFLSLKRNLLMSLTETLVYMPLVLPPSVLGFYLLLIFSPSSFLGAFLQDVLNVKLVFSFQGLILGSVIFSLPFMVSPIKSALISLPTSLKEASYNLGKGEYYTLFFCPTPQHQTQFIDGYHHNFYAHYR
ncbi:hypothetical protein JP0475_14770 [Helicobacter pylori]